MRTRAVALLVALFALALVGVGYVAARVIIGRYKLELFFRLDPTSAKRFVARNAELAPATGPRIVLFGDSRVEMWAPDPPAPGAQLVNRGLGGETTAQALLRLDRDVIALEPDLAIVQYGINDLRAIGVYPERAQELTEACREQLFEIVDRLLARRIRVLVLTVFPTRNPSIRSLPTWSSQIEPSIRAVNRALLERLPRPGLTVVDSDALLSTGKTPWLRDELAADDVHLNQRGYEALNRALAPQITAALAERGAR